MQIQVLHALNTFKLSSVIIKFTLEQATKAQSGSIRIALLFH